VKYREEALARSLDLWGECIPLICQSKDELRVLLSKSIADVQESKSKGALHSDSPEVKIRRLRIICHRLRHADLLGLFLSSPSVCTDLENQNGQFGPAVPALTSDLVRSLDQIVSEGIVECDELKQFYLALCHRYHSVAILMDGLYYLTETDSGGLLATSAANKHLSTGDTVRVGGVGSGSLQFDPLKCADSIAIVPSSNEQNDQASDNSSIHQRASKVWGTALASKYYNPKSGVHRWAVRMDKCERGHIFIGVAVAQASAKTYIGGDKFGWGMIGTQALWHDRRKVWSEFAWYRTRLIHSPFVSDKRRLRKHFQDRIDNHRHARL
jgi:hypothetical protein